MKKAVTAVCALVCAAVLCACATKQEGKIDTNGAERERTEGTVDVPEEMVPLSVGQTSNTQLEVTWDDRPEADVQNGEINENGQDSLPSVRMQEFDEQYSNTQDEPVEELYRLLATAGQSMQSPIGENQMAKGQEQDYYEELIAAAQECIVRNNGEVPDGYDFSSVIYRKQDGVYGILGYLIEDLDGDGTKELIFGANVPGEEDRNDSWDGIIYDVYTVSDGKLVHVLDGWERNRYYLCTNGMIANESSGGAANSNYSYYTFDGLKLNLAESVIFDGWKDANNPWFYSKESEYDAENADPISEGQAEEIQGKYVYVRPDFIPFIDG